jgi:homoserine kinase
MRGVTFRPGPVRVRVPATSANLGPGFDACGLALALYDDVVVRATDSGLQVDVDGEGVAAVPRTEKHLVVQAVRAGLTALGGQPDGLALSCTNRIPHGRGLGSSAAAIVAGLVAARAMVVGGQERLDDDALLQLATRMEGHPDNVAACLHGAYTVAWTGDDSVAHARRLDVGPGLVPVAFVPPTQVRTSRARRLLPSTVPFADAALDAGRAALLTAAVTADPVDLEVLLAATEDRLHQPYRAAAMPRSAALVERLRADGVAAVISGAGPTVLARCDQADATRVAGLSVRGFSVRVLGIDRLGARVMRLRSVPR